MPVDPARRRGRPRLDPTGQPSVPTQVTLTARDFDQAWRIARQRRESIQDLIRRSVWNEIARTPR